MSRRMKEITERRVNGWLYTLEYDTKRGTYEIVEHDADDYPYESIACNGKDEATARKEFAIYCDSMQRDDYEPEPDWEMQAEYDEMHGTINGQDPGVVAMRELWGE